MMYHQFCFNGMHVECIQNRDKSVYTKPDHCFLLSEYRVVKRLVVPEGPRSTLG